MIYNFYNSQEPFIRDTCGRGKLHEFYFLRKIYSMICEISLISDNSWIKFFNNCISYKNSEQAEAEAQAH